jgi:hypothetical protein
MIHHFERILFDRILKNDVIILGGGGMLNFNNKWNEQINRILNLCDNVISWGIGRNTHNEWGMPTTKIDYEKFKLLGVRDWMPELRVPNERFVPCAFCLMPWLSEKRKTRRKWGVVEHWNFPIHAFDSYKIDKIVNANSIEVIRDFILTSDVIITNTYHIAYWSALALKKCILFSPFSSMFKYLKYLPVKFSGDLNVDTNALSECRKLNLDFLHDVKKILHPETSHINLIDKVISATIRKK